MPILFFSLTFPHLRKLLIYPLYFVKFELNTKYLQFQTDISVMLFPPRQYNNSYERVLRIIRLTSFYWLTFF